MQFKRRSSIVRRRVALVSPKRRGKADRQWHSPRAPRHDEIAITVSPISRKKWARSVVRCAVIGNAPFCPQHRSTIETVVYGKRLRRRPGQMSAWELRCLVIFSLTRWRSLFDGTRPGEHKHAQILSLPIFGAPLFASIQSAISFAAKHLLNMHNALEIQIQ